DPNVLAKEDSPVQLLEIEGEIEGEPHACILELLAAGIESKRLHDPAAALGELFQNHAPVLDPGETLGRHPILDVQLIVPIEVIGLECFECDCSITKIFETYLVEIVASDIDVEILAPIVLHPLVDDRAAGYKFSDSVGAVAERRLECGRADIALPPGLVDALPPVFGQHLELADNDRHFAVSGTVEGEGDFALSGLLHFRAVAIGGR